jgi:hypothetical protein
VARAGAPICHISIRELRDLRSDPSVLGVVLGRAVRGPADAATWLHNVIAGLGSRGFRVTFDGVDEPADTRGVQLVVELRTTWVTTTASNKTANIVLRTTATTTDGAPTERNVRGSRSTINWSASDDELRTLVDEAFGVALDELAAMLGPLCPSG